MELGGGEGEGGVVGFDQILLGLDSMLRHPNVETSREKDKSLQVCRIVET